MPWLMKLRTDVQEHVRAEERYGVESAAANVALGPVAAPMDCMKDAVRGAMGKA
jgi:hypothetical protein